MKRSGKKHFTASAIIFDEHERVLMHFHQKLKMWLYPGGHIEDNEEPQDAMFREVHEEVGVIPNLIAGQKMTEMRLDVDFESVEELAAPFTILCEKVTDKSDGEHWHIDMIYLCRLPADSVDENNAFQWLELRQIEMLPATKEFPSLIKRALSVLRLSP